MPLTTGTSRVSRKLVQNPHWSATHRVAYDADEDEDEQLAQPGSIARGLSDPSLLVKSTEALARITPRLQVSRSRADSRTQAKSSISNLPTHKNSIDRFETPRDPTPLTDLEPLTKNSGTLSSDTVKYSKDDWIIIKPFDESSRWHRGYYGRWIKLPGRDWQFRAARVQPKDSIGYRPPTFRKPKATFMDLPAEIRNTVYEYVIPERSVLISRTHPKKEARYRQMSWSEEHVALKSYRSRLTHEPEWDCLSDDFVSAINLLLTCKEVKSEVETFLYSRILFCFRNLKSLRRFLHAGPETGLGTIRKVFIMQDGYGNAQTTEYQKYRERYYHGWEGVCTLLGQKAPNLKHLKLKVYDRDWPIELSGKNYTPAWRTSILKTSTSLIPKVEVRIHHMMIDRNEEVLKDLARHVEDSMMTQEGRDNRDRLESEQAYAEIAARKAAREERERKRKAKLNAPPPPTELVISMDDIRKQADKVSTVNKVRSKGLEKFEKVDLNVYNFHVECYD